MKYDYFVSFHFTDETRIACVRVEFVEGQFDE